MVLVLREAFDILKYWIVSFSDPRTDDWWMVSTPIPIFILTGIYVYGSLHLGPRLMAKRPAFDPKAAIVCYNVFQVVNNAALFVFGIYASYYRDDFQFLCQPLSPPGDCSPEGMNIIYGAVWYLVLKLADYMDTLFFVLRKQNGHVSFLHVYHHALMGFVGFFGVRYAPGGNGAILVLANTLVHTVMYTYYLLSALESTRATAMRWKKQITQLQLVQFLFIGSHFTQAYFDESCTFPKVLCATLMLQNIFMSALFLDFYRRTYWRPATSRPAKAAKLEANGLNGKTEANGKRVGTNGTTNGTTPTSKAANGVQPNGAATTLVSACM